MNQIRRERKKRRKLNRQNEFKTNKFMKSWREGVLKKELTEHIQNIQKAVFLAAGIPMPQIETKHDRVIVPEFMAENIKEALKVADDALFTIKDLAEYNDEYFDIVSVTLDEEGYIIKFEIFKPRLPVE